MRLEHYSEKKLKKEIKEIVSRHLDLKKYKIFFFGSRVKGDNLPGADIDIGIEGSQEVPSKIMAEIREEIFDLSTLYRIDIVDFQETGDDFREVAKQNMEIIK